MADPNLNVMAVEDPTGPQAVEAAVIALQDHFWRNSEMQCLLIVDPQPQALPTQAKNKHPLADLPRTVVPIAHDAFPRSDCPYLLTLDSRAAQFGAWLAASVRVALADRRPDAISRVPGQRIGGWLATSASANDVAEHFSRQVLQLDDRGKTCALRFYDARALALLWPVLTLMQKETLLGPVKTWLAFDAGTRLQTYAGLYPKCLDHLSLKPEQWDAIRRHGLVNRALALHVAATGQQVEPGLVDAAIAAAARAELYELADRDDKLAFISHALAWHPYFDAHPRVRQALGQVSQGDFYAAAASELTPDDIDAIRSGTWYAGKQNDRGGLGV